MEVKYLHVFLDIEKAFDKLWWNGFFLKLHKVGITHKLWHLFRIGLWAVAVGYV